MKISVIVPIHNLENEIINALESIYNQNFEKSEYEILAIFDSCTDKSEEVVKEWYKNSSSVMCNLL